MPCCRASSSDQPPRVHPGIVGEEPGQEVRRVVRLQPRRLVRRHRERRRVRLAEPEARELRHRGPGLLGGRRGRRRARVAAPGSPRGTPAASPRGPGGDGCGRRRSGRSRRSRRASGSPARGRRSRRTSPERRTQVGVDVDRRLHAQPPAQVRRDHVGLHRPGTEQRDVDDQVLPPGGLELLEQLALAGRLDLEAAERVGGADQLERGGSRRARSGRGRPSRRSCARSRPGRGASTRASGCPGRRASGSRAARRRPCRPGSSGGRSRSARAAPGRPGRGSTARCRTGAGRCGVGSRPAARPPGTAARAGGVAG